MKENNEIREFASREFGRVRMTLSATGEPLLCMRDVQNALGYSPKTSQGIMRYIQKGQSVKLPCGRFQMVFITMDGLKAVLNGTGSGRSDAFARYVDDVVLSDTRMPDSRVPDVPQVTDIPADMLRRMHRFAGLIVRLRSIVDEFADITADDVAKNDPIAPEFKERLLESLSAAAVTIGTYSGLRTASLFG